MTDDTRRMASIRILTGGRTAEERKGAMPTDDIDKLTSKTEVNMTFKEFSEINASRCTRWHSIKSWSLSDWATATAGALGEACNLIKKLNRLRDGVAGNEGRELDQVFLRECLAEELADTFTYLDLLATAAGIDLEKAVIMRFNAVSEKQRMPERIEHAH